MSGFVATEKGVPIRMPSVAHLMIDSVDRNEAVYPSAWDYTINKNNNIQNGYFTRIACTEFVLEWCEPNISSAAGNTTLSLDISGTGANTYVNADLGISINSGFYNVSQALNAVVAELNTLTGTTGATFSIGNDGRNVFIDCSGAEFAVNPGVLGNQLEITADQTRGTAQLVGACPDLRVVRFLDFVSEQLTYAQDVKDTSTAATQRNVLLRWYMAWDNPPTYDSLGFPILMGYTDFVARRLFNPAKQIKWNPQLPVGNMSFQVYDDTDRLMIQLDPNNNYTSNWLMTLQLSEV